MTKEAHWFWPVCYLTIAQFLRYHTKALVYTNKWLRVFPAQKVTTRLYLKVLQITKDENDISKYTRLSDPVKYTVEQEKIASYFLHSLYFPKHILYSYLYARASHPQGFLKRPVGIFSILHSYRYKQEEYIKRCMYNNIYTRDVGNL